jgi:hypothetical protein
MEMRSLSSSMYRAARLTRDVEAIQSGHAGRRAKNIVVGRALARAGFWSLLWGGTRRR